MMRTSFSLKQMAMPCAVASRMSLVARRLQHGDQLVALAERQRTDAGLSGRIQAVQLEPLDCALLRHEEQIVLFKSCTVMPAVTFSPGSSGRILTMFVPRAVRPASGI